MSSKAGTRIAITARASSATAAATSASAAPGSTAPSGRRCSHWLPLTDLELAVYEGGLFEDAPAHAVALLVRPPTIWSLAEAVAAEQQFPRGRRFTPRRFAAIERHAYGRIRADHLTRLRWAMTRIAAQLPTAGLPVASATVAAGCALVAEDDSRARAVAARQLARYASSALVGAYTRKSGR